MSLATCWVSSIDYMLDATGTLHLSSTTAGQTYHMAVTATATDPATGATVSGQTMFDPIGRFHGLPWPDQTALLRCMQPISPRI
jgi:hypothetical protein